MGAHDISQTFEGAPSFGELLKWHLKAREQGEYDYGHDPYNGTWSTI
ncbi:unnamed protein product, partial [marine sediment metagenome]